MSVKMIVAGAADAFGLTYLEITGKGRAKTMVKARVAASIALRRRGFSYPRIGKLLGGRDHSSIIYYCDRCTHLLKDAAFAELVDRLAAIRTNVALVGISGPKPKRKPSAKAKPVPGPVALPRLRVPPPPSPRRLFLEGRIDGEQMKEMEHAAMMREGSILLAHAIKSQFWVKVAA